MNKMLAVLIVIFTIAFVPISYAKVAKSGTTTVTQSYIIIPSGAENSVDGAGSAQLIEEFGVVLSDEGKAPFHNMSTRDVAVVRNVPVLLLKKHQKYMKKILRYGTWIDQDGDKFFVEGKLEPEKNGKNIREFVGGTGKYKNMNVTIVPILTHGRPVLVKSSVEGYIFGVQKYQISWEPKK